jgi:hypothetical protein
MTEKRLNTRIVHKHETEANWILAVNFTPMQGEIIIYDIDENYDYERLKIGDGVKNVNALPFINDAVNILPKCTTITLSNVEWAGDTNPWSQVVSINGVTANSKVDLQPTAVQIVELQNEDIAFMAENDNGVVTVYALGSKPTKNYTMQALITEVTVV